MRSFFKKTEKRIYYHQQKKLTAIIIPIIPIFIFLEIDLFLTIKAIIPEIIALADITPRTIP